MGSKCPACHAPAYIGLNQVECPTQGCVHYSEKEREAFDRVRATRPTVPVPEMKGLQYDPYSGEWYLVLSDPAARAKVIKGALARLDGYWPESRRYFDRG